MKEFTVVFQSQQNWAFTLSEEYDFCLLLPDHGIDITLWRKNIRCGVILVDDTHTTVQSLSVSDGSHLGHGFTYHQDCLWSAGVLDGQVPDYIGQTDGLSLAAEIVTVCWMRGKRHAVARVWWWLGESLKGLSTYMLCEWCRCRFRLRLRLRSWLLLWLNEKGDTLYSFFCACPYYYKDILKWIYRGMVIWLYNIKKKRNDYLEW